MKKTKEKKGSVLSDANLSRIKELFLTVLFPKVCPVCGKALSLPRGWSKILTDRSHRSGLSAEEIRRYCSALICKECIRAVSFVADPSCAVCSRPLDQSEEPLCDLCSKKAFSFDRGKALTVHAGAGKKILYDLKFHNMREYADTVGFFLALRFADEIRKWKGEALIPVPLHKKRMRERGFNQAFLIAARTSFWLEKLFGLSIPVEERILVREENTKPQRTLPAEDRQKNVRNAFSVSERKAYHSVILIDDIFTSGSTLDACAKTLKKAGTAHVFFLTASIVSG